MDENEQIPQDEENTETGSTEESVRRVGAGSRKKRLDPVESLFSEDDDKQPEETPIAEPYDLPSHLADLALEIDVADRIPVAVPEASPKERKNTPSAERFPPTPEQLKAREQAEREAARAAARPEKKPRRVGDWRHNVVAAIFALMTLMACGYFTVVWVNPWTPLNPLAPPTSVTYVTFTPDPLEVVAATGTALAGATAIPTDSPTETPSPTIEPTPTDLGAVIPGFFALQSRNAYRTPQGEECGPATIVGTVTGLENVRLNGYRVQIIDVQDPASLSIGVFTRRLPDIGDGAYEYILPGDPRDRAYQIRLFDPDGTPVSEPYELLVGADCEQLIPRADFIPAG
jgi:hypothetical protein